MAATVGLVLTGCTGGGAASGGSADGEIAGTITFQSWSLKNETFTPYFKDLIKSFEEKYPDVTVKWVDQPAEGYEDKVLQQAESNQLPDVINLPPDMANSLVDAGLLSDFKKDAPDALELYVPGGLDAYTYDGADGVYGLPWYLGTDLNFWNTGLMEEGGVTEIPESFDDMLNMSETLGGEGIVTISSVPSLAVIKAAIEDAGGDFDIYADGKFAFNTPEAAEIIDRYADVYKAGGVSAEALNGVGEANSNVNAFNQGTVVWTTSAPSYVENDLSVNAPNLVDKVGVSHAFGAPPLFVQGVSVAENSQNKAAALAFAKYLTNNENQVEFVKLAPGFFPGTKEANEDPTSFAGESEIELQQKATELAASQMDKAKTTAEPFFTDTMNTYVTQQIALAVRGDISAEDALEKGLTYCENNVVK
ncbi:ABC transporter substrate-binding protein [Paramicrobacterium sp. CJ85]|uniref:ABC transporter substrate-binding protein n=1 Tax=Paramicrobacterium sp. CJ85 TaxID=3445355 RepID=UPI003F6043B0